MKKKLLLIAGLAVMGSLKVSAQFTITNLTLPVQHADVSAVDIDGDGDLDLIIAGEYPLPPNLRELQVYTNDGAGNFTSAPSIFPPISHTTFDWGDINQDGKLDMIYNGFNDTLPYAAIFTSNGTGTFTASGITLPQLSPSCGFADFNNDGYLDIYVFGNYFDGRCNTAAGSCYNINHNCITCISINWGKAGYNITCRCRSNRIIFPCRAVVCTSYKIICIRLRTCSYPN